MDVKKNLDVISNEVAGGQSSDIQVQNPWTMQVAAEQDPQKYKLEHDATNIDILTPQLASLSTFDYNKNLANLQSIIQDILAGDESAMNRPEYQCLNFPAIKSAIEWLMKTDQFSQDGKANLIDNAWRLNFKVRPPTPAEFLTEKYIGGQAETMYKPVVEAFLKAMDPIAPYRTIVLSCHIGFGKNQKLDAKIFTDEHHTKLMGDIKPGDIIRSPGGGQTEVLATQDCPPMDMYEVELEDGKKTSCGLHHLHHISYRKNDNGEMIWENVETEFIINHPEFDFYFQEDNVDDSVQDAAYVSQISRLGKGMKIVKLKSIKKTSFEKSRCIAVANPNGLYVTDGGIVTHNSLLTVLVNLYIAVHFALMWHPYKFFGQSPATIYTQIFAAWSQKKGSELLLEPMTQLLEQSPYFKKIRTHSEMVDISNDANIADEMAWTSASASSALSIQNGANFKLTSSAGGLLGQSQPLDCKVYLPDGSYKLMGDVKVGDVIASPTEGKQTVLGVFPKGKKPTYRITLTDGRTTRSSPDHLWKISWQQKNGKKVWEVKPLQFILDHPELDIDIWDMNDDITTDS